MFTRASGYCSLKTAQAQCVRSQSEVGFRLAAASREPQQIGHGLALVTTVRVVKVCETRQIQQEKCELKRKPTAVSWDVDLRHLGGLPAPHCQRIESVDALPPHRAIGKAEGFRRVRVTAEQRNPFPNASQYSRAIGQRFVCGSTILA